MKTRPTLILLVLITLALLAVGQFARAQVSGPVISHWNAQGRPDGYTSPAVAIYLLPLATLAAGLLVVGLPALDPLRKNVQSFRAQINVFALYLAGFMAYLYLLTWAYNLGWIFNLVQFLLPAVAALFWGAGWLLPRAQRNWFVGIRTPWTLSSDRVWQQTHRLGGRLFRALAVVCLVAAFFPDAAFFLLLGPLLLVSLGLVVYSWAAYRRIETREPEN